MGCRVVSIGEVASSISEPFDFKKNTSIVLVNTGDVDTGVVLNHQKLLHAEVKGQFKKSFQKDDILYSEIRPRNRHYAFIDFDASEYVASTKLMVIRANHAVIRPHFLYAFLTSAKTVTQLQAAAESRSGTFPQITFDEVARLTIDLPPLEEQDRILAVHSTIEAKIALNAKLNGYLLELLKASAKNLYAEYERNEELELPVGWRWIEVDEISEMVCRGITPKYNPNSDETVLGQTCVRNNLVLPENGRPHSPKKVTEKWLQKYDLLINSTGVGSLGRTAQIWFEPTKLVVDSHVTIVRCKDEKHALYLGFWAFEHEKYIESLHTGSTGQTELPRDHVKAIRLVLPSDEALERFNKMSEPSVRLIAANQEESKRLADLRDALLPKLVSGEIDVSRIDLTQLNSHLA